MASSNNDENDDLYSDDYPELRRKGVRVHDILGPTKGADSTETVPLGSGLSSDLSPPRSPPAFPEQAEIDAHRARREISESERQRERWDQEITWREAQISQQVVRMRNRLRVRFVNPVPAALPIRYRLVVNNLEGSRPAYCGLLSELAVFPDLLFRYFEVEKVIIDVIQRCRKMKRFEDDEYIVFTKALERRRDEMQAYRRQYEAAAMVLLQHIEQLLCIEISDNVTDAENKQQLTLLDDTLMNEIINPNPVLRRHYEDIEQMERVAFKRRFCDPPKWTGTPPFVSQVLFIEEDDDDSEPYLEPATVNRMDGDNFDSDDAWRQWKH
ncbi:hypothetical protein N0V90_011560 [Kalmusia sp. IMI 367209]|nr:hypothetical protein N0V90_011560 [Kalmusia sp. IMI 367209]